MKAKEILLRKFSNEFYYVAPEGVIPENKLPKGAGLIEVVNGKLKTTVEAIYVDNNPDWGIIVSIARRLRRNPEIVKKDFYK